MTATAADLQIEFRRLRDEDRETGMKRMATLSAYNAWFKQSCAEGNPPDALQRNAGTDSGRFFSRTISGLDGHTYWDGPCDLRFRLNAGGERNARWWWYERVYGKQGRGKLGATCGERNCITPEHQQFVPWSIAKRTVSDQQILSALQTAALRLGHAPTIEEYGNLRLRPHHQIIRLRFGGWNNAVMAAGLIPSFASVHKRGPEDCIAAVQYLARYLGRTPSDKDFRINHAILSEAGLPPAASTIRRHLGSWSEALRKAGLPSEDASATRGTEAS